MDYSTDKLLRKLEILGVNIKKYKRRYFDEISDLQAALMGVKDLFNLSIVLFEYTQASIFKYQIKDSNVHCFLLREYPSRHIRDYYCLEEVVKLCKQYKNKKK